MESYGRFAGVYDVFMDNVNYREWADYIIETLAQDGIRDGLVLELGCGTGTVTEMLADAGYDMIGIDNSEEMLAEAMEKRAAIASLLVTPDAPFNTMHTSFMLFLEASHTKVLPEASVYPSLPPIQGL